MTDLFGPPVPPGFQRQVRSYEKLPPGFQPPPVTPDEHPLWGQLRRAHQSDDPLATEHALTAIKALVAQIAQQETLDDLRLIAAQGMMQGYKGQQQQALASEQAGQEMRDMLTGITYANVRAPGVHGAYREWIADYETRRGAGAPPEWPQYRQAVERQLKFGESISADEQRVRQMLEGDIPFEPGRGGALPTIAHVLSLGAMGRAGDPRTVQRTRLNEAVDAAAAERYGELPEGRGLPSMNAAGFEAVMRRATDRRRGVRPDPPDLPQDEYRELLRASLGEKIAREIEQDPKLRETGGQRFWREASGIGAMLVPFTGALKGGAAAGKAWQEALKIGTKTLGGRAAAGGISALTAGAGLYAYELLAPTPPERENEIMALPPEERDMARAIDRHERGILTAITMPLYVLGVGRIGALGGAVGGRLGGLGRGAGAAAGAGAGLTAAGEGASYLLNEVRGIAERSQPDELILGPWGEAMRRGIAVGQVDYEGPIQRILQADSAKDALTAFGDFAAESAPAAAGIGMLNLAAKLAGKLPVHQQLEQPFIESIRARALREIDRTSDETIEGILTELGIEPSAEKIAEFREANRAAANQVAGVALEAAKRPGETEARVGKKDAERRTAEEQAKAKTFPEEEAPSSRTLRQMREAEEAWLAELRERETTTPEEARELGVEQDVAEARVRSARLEEMAIDEPNLRRAAQIREEAAAERQTAESLQKWRDSGMKGERPERVSPEDATTKEALDELARPRAREADEAAIRRLDSPDEQASDLTQAVRGALRRRASLQEKRRAGKKLKTKQKDAEAGIDLNRLFRSRMQPGYRVTDPFGNQWTMIRPEGESAWLAEGPGGRQEVFRPSERLIAGDDAAMARIEVRPPSGDLPVERKTEPTEPTEQGISPAQAETLDALRAGATPRLRGGALQKVLGALRAKGLVDDQGRPTERAAGAVEAQEGNEARARERARQAEEVVDAAGVSAGEPASVPRGAEPAQQSRAAKETRQEQGRERTPGERVVSTPVDGDRGEVLVDGEAGRYSLRRGDAGWRLWDGEEPITPPRSLGETRKAMRALIGERLLAMAEGPSIDTGGRQGPFRPDPLWAGKINRLEDLAARAMTEGTPERAELLSMKAPDERESSALYRMLGGQGELSEVLAEWRRSFDETIALMRERKKDDARATLRWHLTQNAEAYHGPASVAMRYDDAGAKLLRDVLREYEGGTESGQASLDVFRGMSWVRSIVERMGSGTTQADQIIEEGMRAPRQTLDFMDRVFGKTWDVFKDPVSFGGFIAREGIEAELARIAWDQHHARTVFDWRKGILGRVGPDTVEARWIYRLADGQEVPDATPRERTAAARLKKLHDDLWDKLVSVHPHKRAVDEQIITLRQDALEIIGEIRDLTVKRDTAQAMMESLPEHAELEALRAAHGKTPPKHVQSEMAKIGRRIADRLAEHDLLLPKQYHGILATEKGALKGVMRERGNLIDWRRELVRHKGISEYIHHIANPSTPSTQFGVELDQAYGGGPLSSMLPRGKGGARQRPEEVRLPTYRTVWSGIMMRRTGAPVAVEDAVLSMSRYLPEFTRLYTRNLFLARTEKFLWGSRRLARGYSIVERDKQGVEVSRQRRHEAFDPQQEVWVHGRWMRSYGLFKVSGKEGELEPMSDLYRQEGFGEARQEATMARRGRIAAKVEAGPSPSAGEVVVLGTNVGQDISVQRLRDPAYVRSLLSTEKGELGPSRAAQIVLVPRHRARRMIRVQDGGWRDQMAKLASTGHRSAERVADRLIRYVEEQVLGVRRQVTATKSGRGGAPEVTYETIREEARRFHGWAMSASRFVAGYMSAMTIGGPTNIHNAFNAMGGGLVMGSMLLGRRPRASTLRTIKRLPGAMMRIHRAEAAALEHFEKIAEGPFGDVSRYDFLAGMDKHVRTPEADLAKMPERKREEQRLLDDALVAYMKSAVSGINRGDQWNRLLSGYGGDLPKEAARPGRVNAANALAAMSKAYWTPFNIGEAGIRAIFYVDEYVRSRQRGFDDEVSRSRAMLAVHQTQMIYTKAAKSRFLSSWPGVIFGNLQTWAWHNEGVVLRMPLGRQIAYRSATMTLAYVGYLLGTDLFDVLGSRLENVPAAGTFAFRKAMGITEDDPEPSGPVYEAGIKSLFLPTTLALGLTPAARLLTGVSEYLGLLADGKGEDAETKMQEILQSLSPLNANWLRQFSKSRMMLPITSFGVEQDDARDDGTFLWRDPRTGKASSVRLDTGWPEWVRQQWPGQVRDYADEWQQARIERESAAVRQEAGRSVSVMKGEIADILRKAESQKRAPTDIEQQEIRKILDDMREKARGAGGGSAEMFQDPRKFRADMKQAVRVSRLKDLPSSLRAIATISAKGAKMEALARYIEDNGIHRDDLATFLRAQSQNPIGWVGKPGQAADEKARLRLQKAIRSAVR